MKSLRFFFDRIEYFSELTEALGEMLVPDVTALGLGQALPNAWTVARTRARYMNASTTLS